MENQHEHPGDGSGRAHSAEEAGGGPTQKRAPEGGDGLDSEEERVTYFDKLENAWKNSRWAVWIVVTAAIVGGIAVVLTAVKTWITDLSPDAEPHLLLTIYPHDPRWTDRDGALTNWGGGSQALCIETRSEEVTKATYKPHRFGVATRIWESFNTKLTPVTIDVDVYYEADQDSPACIIREWGVEVEVVSAPTTGYFLSYTTGGAEAERTQAVCTIKGATGKYPVTLWTSPMEERVEPPRKVVYHPPRQVVFLQLAVHPPAEPEEVDDPANTQILAMNLTVYAKITISGKEKVARSSRSVRAILPKKIKVYDVFSEDKYERRNLAWNAFRDILVNNLLEESRVQAYFAASE